MRNAGITCICFYMLFPLYAHAQRNQLSDSSIFQVLFKASYAYQFPMLDMAKRFGQNSNIGGAFEVKTASNISIGVKGSFLFGRLVREDTILKGIATKQGYHIDQGGQQATVYDDQRGFTVIGYAGKIFPLSEGNKNSGICVQLGAGVMRHKIRFDWRESTILQLNKEMLKGYDRLSFGPAGELFVGYLFLSKSRMVNFYGGIEYTLAYTKSLRGYNYDTMQYDTQTRTDALWGIRAGWVLPFWRREKKEFFYY